ncbi:dual specificity protein kinase Fuz7 [Ceraceosorus guamensis]|uniref:Dual specificity protein kinase Fuz7 n=1 Tax=Ceraceosorus guamensis TaxID=1522189 RepID=A0A316W5H7_9BASI|nr:dual specificity protein kinase Fuz7 [Ceraceosorus guamensis]PWN43981.1 dual specificity protein kinase Fuz7 [Ceraceosorus guamensis]
MSSIRKKRNFKGLALAESPLSTPSPGQASGSSGPSAGLVSSQAVKARGLPGVGLGAGASAEIDPSSGANYHNKLSEQLANLELGIEYKLDLKNEDLKHLSDLGSGNSGTVSKVLHEKSATTMAKKVVFIDAKPTVRKQILRELQILHECNSKYIVSFYGAYLSEPHICMCMEFMDKTSLDNIYKKWGPVPVDVLGKVIVVVVHGLTYLYDVHRIIHRDVKPSNILVNGQGQIKICDFGVSGELINSIADTFVGTSTYMSPERIQGDQYSVKSDVWSLGISVIELALGRFPFANPAEDSDDEIPEELRGTLSPTKPDGLSQAASRPKRADVGARAGVSLEGSGAQMSILDLLQHIVNEPPPHLPEDSKFPKAMHECIDLCLIKDPSARPSPTDLTVHPYVKESEEKKVDLKAWVDTLV